MALRTISSEVIKDHEFPEIELGSWMNMYSILESHTMFLISPHSLFLKIYVMIKIFIWGKCKLKCHLIAMRVTGYYAKKQETAEENV